MEERDPVNMTRYANAAARLMDIYREGLVALHRIKAGGRQTVTVQHVHVADGGQAIVGAVSGTGDYEGGRMKTEQRPHAQDGRVCGAKTRSGSLVAIPRCQTVGAECMGDAVRVRSPRGDASGFPGRG